MQLEDELKQEQEIAKKFQDRQIYAAGGEQDQIAKVDLFIA